MSILGKIYAAFELGLSQEITCLSFVNANCLTLHGAQWISISINTTYVHLARNT